MKKSLFFFGLLFFIPNLAFAQCINTGATVIYINGIFGTKEQTKEDKKNLEKNFIRLGRNDVKFINGYNESHLGGVGDLVQSIAQMLDGSVSNYDLNAILLQIHPQLTTRRVLLVGHSQGALYANAIYNYFLAHGVPRQAAGVYAIGTPALLVADGNGHLNSTNDHLLNLVDAIAGKSPLSRNITLPLDDADKTSQWPGHGLSSAYLAQGADRVVGDIKGELGALQPISASETGECFSAPPADLAYQLQKTGFVVADTAAAGIKVGVRAGLGAAQSAMVAASNIMVASVIGTVGVVKKVGTDIGITVGGVAGISKAGEPSSNPINFSIIRRLYGSSLSKQEYGELVGQQESAVAAASLFVQVKPGPSPAASSSYPARPIILNGSRKSFVSSAAANVSGAGGVYAGVVGSSTLLFALAGPGNGTGPDESIDYSGIPSSEPVFVAVWEESGSGSSEFSAFNSYFAKGAPEPPHQNFTILPWLESSDKI